MPVFWWIAIGVGALVALSAKKAASAIMKAYGYKQGNRLLIDLIEVEPKKGNTPPVLLEKNTAIAFVRMRDAAKMEGILLDANSGWRSMAEQEDIYADRQKHPEKGVAARPGFSNHQAGTAVDIQTKSDSRVFPWLEKNAAKYGFFNTVKSEPWHWEKLS